MSSPDITTELVRAPRNTLAVMSDSEINRSWRLAEALYSSGSFPDVRSAAQAFAVMLIGHDLGMSPTQALMGVHLIKGKPRISSTSLAGFLKKGGKYDFKVMHRDHERCTIDFYEVRPSEPSVTGQLKRGDRIKLGRETFTMADAVTAELVNEITGPRGEVSYKRRAAASEGWEKYPKNMLFARAMSNGVKAFCSDAMGGVPVYTEADEFSAQPLLTAGSGDGEAVGVDLGWRVEAVLERAQRLGHAGLSNRAAAETALASRSPEALGEWVRIATNELDELERGQNEAVGSMEEADVVEPTPAQMRDQAEELHAEADHLDEHEPGPGQTARDLANDLEKRAGELTDEEAGNA